MFGCGVSLFPAWLRLGGGTPVSTLVNGLEHYWALDETSGVRYDSKGTADLTDNNTVGSASGMHNAAASFVGANTEFLSRPFDSSLNITGAVTYSCWIKTTSGAAFQNVMGWDFPDAFPSIMLVINDSTYRLFYAASGADWQRLDTSDNSAVNGNWHHFLAWWDPADKKGHVQIDGGTVMDGVALAGSSLRSATTQDWKMGSWTFGNYTGLIDEGAIWSRLLTSDERTELYNAGVGKFYDGSNFV